jgi:hypothetical protein
MDQGDLRRQNSNPPHPVEELRGSAPGGTAQEAAGPPRTAGADRNTLDRAKDAAASAVSSVSLSVKQVLDRQVGTGADLAVRLARSARTVADDLNGETPQIASVVRAMADRIDSYADELRDQSIDQLVSAAADFTRRQPALVLGVAALTGFFAVRVVLAAPPVTLAGTEGRADGD